MDARKQRSILILIIYEFGLLMFFLIGALICAEYTTVILDVQSRVYEHLLFV